MENKTATRGKIRILKIIISKASTFPLEKEKEEIILALNNFKTKEEYKELIKIAESLISKNNRKFQKITELIQTKGFYFFV